MELESGGQKESAGPASRPAKSSLYQPAIALEFFKTFGKVESVAAGKAVFVEDEDAAGVFAGGRKMYLLLDGEVELSVRKKPLGKVGKGQIFGEMASISHQRRSATAMAKTASKVIALDEKQFLGAMTKSPAFALMLMSVLIGRLRDTVIALVARAKLAEGDNWNQAALFDKKVVDDLQRELEDKPAQTHPLNKLIVKEGDRGVFMYLVVEGVVAITVQDKPLEKVGPGGVFGEVALVDQSQRMATAVAETDCVLLAINRNDFLDLVQRKPAFALGLLKALAERMRFLTSKYK